MGPQESQLTSQWLMFSISGEAIMVSTYCARDGKDLFLKYHREPEKMSRRSAVIAVLHNTVQKSVKCFGLKECLNYILVI